MKVSKCGAVKGRSSDGPIRVNNEEVIHRINKERYIVHRTKRRLTGLVISYTGTAF